MEDIATRRAVSTLVAVIREGRAADRASQLADSLAAGNGRRYITVNAYRPAEAESAVRQQARRDGQQVRHVIAYATKGQLGPDDVALQVTKTSDGRAIGHESTRTYVVALTRVSAEVDPPSAAAAEVDIVAAAHAAVAAVDITPTWAGILPALLAVIENGETFEARNLALAELRRMAELADRYAAALRDGAVTA